MAGPSGTLTLDTTQYETALENAKRTTASWGKSVTLQGENVSATFKRMVTCLHSQTDPFFSTLKDWGRAMMDLWLHNGGSAPVMMTQLSKVPTPPPPTVTITAPTNLTATAGKGSVALKWTASTVTPTAPITYKIYTVSAGKYTYIGSSTTTSFTHAKQRAGTTFTYVVTGTVTINGITYESAYSNMAGPVTVK